MLKIKIVLSTGKEIELTCAEFNELQSQFQQPVLPFPIYPVYPINPYWSEYPHKVTCTSGTGEENGK